MHENIFKHTHFTVSQRKAINPHSLVADQSICQSNKLIITPVTKAFAGNKMIDILGKQDCVL